MPSTDARGMPYQDEYMACISEIEITPERARQLNHPVAKQEQSELGAILGGMQWLVGQSMVFGNVDVNIIQFDVTTVETQSAANKVLRKLRNSPNRLYTTKIESKNIHLT